MRRALATVAMIDQLYRYWYIGNSRVEARADSFEPLTPRAGKDGIAVRAVVRGRVQGVGYRDATVRRARRLGAMGWVRNEDDGSVLVHAEGSEEAVEGLLAFLREGPRGAQVDEVEVERLKVEGHEQFAIRGVSAGAFVVQEHAATAHHFDLRLEVDGVDALLGGPQGPLDGPGGQAARGAGRGPRRSPTTPSRGRPTAAG